MSVSYNKLWKLLIDHGMNKSDLGKAAKMSPNTIARLGKNEMVSFRSFGKNMPSFTMRHWRNCRSKFGLRQ